jgi:hypothetical protein
MIIQKESRLIRNRGTGILPVFFIVHRLEADATLWIPENSAGRRITHELARWDATHIDNSMGRVRTANKPECRGSAGKRITPFRRRIASPRFIFLDGGANQGACGSARSGPNRRSPDSTRGGPADNGAGSRAVACACSGWAVA